MPPPAQSGSEVPELQFAPSGRPAPMSYLVEQPRPPGMLAAWVTLGGTVAVFPGRVSGQVAARNLANGMHLCGRLREEVWLQVRPCRRLPIWRLSNNCFCSVILGMRRGFWTVSSAGLGRPAAAARTDGL